jgi:hypothetical protein
MPLIKPVLELQILAAFQKMSNSETNMAQAQQDLAKDLATAIDVYIKSATVIVSPGQVVTGAAGTIPVIASTISPGTAIIS